MPVKDMKLLRDQLAKVIGENRSLEAKLEEAYGKNAEQALMVDRLALKLSLATAKLDEALAKIAKQEEIIVEVTGSKAKAERILQYYDNAHTPPRNRTITQREINKQKKEERKKKNPTGRRGRHKGCTNTAVSRKATRTVVHRPDRCKSCGGGNLEAERTDNELVVDIPFIPQIEVVNHRLDTCKCLDCGKITTPSRTGLVRGTSLGPNLLKMTVGLWSMNASYEGIGEFFSGLFGMDGCAKSTVQHGLGSMTPLMEPDANAMFEEMKSKKGPVGIDESPITVPDRTGQIWLAADEDTTLVKVAASRAEAVLREIFPFFERPLTADGYRPYRNLFKTLQRCWAHISRESESQVRIARERSGVSSTDCRDAQARHDRLMLIYHEAKEMVTATPGQCDVLVQRTIEVARTYPEKLANKIIAAAPYLFTFLRHRGMQSTNNHTERDLRRPILRRKVSGQIGSVEGMHRFGVLFTCLLTWRKRKLNIYRELDRILMAQT